MAKKLWAIKVVHGNEDHGWVVEHGRVVGVYDDKDLAEKEAKWLNDFKKRCGTKGSYEVRKWTPEDGLETVLLTPSSMKQSENSTGMLKMSEKRTASASKPSTTESSSAAPMPTIPTNLSDLFVGG
jgi:hypothetical protein